ncbi:metal-dependent hydrolase [Campylobacter sp. FMV-PI01]|uniref:Metal-dependent hydrolase n=1 Tax=Campylobacter portucalensis TaxID=2608384 RepID=A0A6L5WJ10_9BACT|nr:metal-dependent hydrolase [Campylobacter portucalensis]MSN97149.1 metal-dependent hydrolase [Campylobacter portucalensis]
MKILKAKYILVCDENFTILKNKAIVFDEEILDVGEFENLIKIYKNADILDFSKDIVMPNFINLHTHLEFSANKASLVYGDFLKWVNSIVKQRNHLVKDTNKILIKTQILEMLKSGVGTIGEISSFGQSLEAIFESKIRCVYFNEILGTNEEIIDKNWQDFLIRFRKSEELKSDLLIPGVSIHSPYSTHPKLTKKACEFAKSNNLLVSTHFLESNHENKWLRSKKGGFKKWLLNFAKNPKPLYNISEFIDNFQNIRTLFTHCVYLKEFNLLDKNLHSITHCAVSNRFLSKKTLNLKKVLKNKINLTIATDGLSSNISLNFFDELRANLFIHSNYNLQNLAKILLISSTLNPAKALNLNLGSIESKKLADFSVYDGLEVEDESQIALNLILHTKQVKEIYIKGKKWDF